MTVGEFRYILGSAESLVRNINDHVYKQGADDEETKLLESASETIEQLIAVISGFSL